MGHLLCECPAVLGLDLVGFSEEGVEWLVGSFLEPAPEGEGEPGHVDLAFEGVAEGSGDAEGFGVFDQLDEALEHGDRFTKGCGDWNSPKLVAIDTSFDQSLDKLEEMLVIGFSSYWELCSEDEVLMFNF